ncbi:MAG: hypothetical protein ACKOTZ_09430, partial [Chloroflexota bacterium]
MTDERTEADTPAVVADLELAEPARGEPRGERRDHPVREAREGHGSRFRLRPLGRHADSSAPPAAASAPTTGGVYASFAALGDV